MAWLAVAAVAAEYWEGCCPGYFGEMNRRLGLAYIILVLVMRWQLRV